MTLRKTGMALGAALMLVQAGFAGSSAPDSTGSRLQQQVRRELVTLPFYNLFDTLSFRIDGDTVTLTGKVTRPTLKTDAERVVQRVEGVTAVRNQIQVLPVSPNDDRLRLSLYRSIYGHTMLQTLAIRAVPPIHITVENGNVTLEGSVLNAMEKTVAGMQASAVPGVFSVTNNLAVDSES